jgi:hypothetical protein
VADSRYPWYPDSGEVRPSLPAIGVFCGYCGDYPIPNFAQSSDQATLLQDHSMDGRHAAHLVRCHSECNVCCGR